MESDHVLDRSPSTGSRRPMSWDGQLLSLACWCGSMSSQCRWTTVEPHPFVGRQSHSLHGSCCRQPATRAYRSLSTSKVTKAVVTTAAACVVPTRGPRRPQDNRTHHNITISSRSNATYIQHCGLSLAALGGCPFRALWRYQRAGSTCPNPAHSVPNAGLTLSCIQYPRTHDTTVPHMHRTTCAAHRVVMTYAVHP